MNRMGLSSMDLSRIPNYLMTSEQCGRSNARFMRHDTFPASTLYEPLCLAHWSFTFENVRRPIHHGAAWSTVTVEHQCSARWEKLRDENCEVLCSRVHDHSRSWRFYSTILLLQRRIIIRNEWERFRREINVWIYMNIIFNYSYYYLCLELFAGCTTQLRWNGATIA